MIEEYNAGYDDGYARAKGEASERICLLELMLKPFALAADDLEEGHGNSYDIWESPAAMSIAAGALRDAKKALNT